jgi:hypothetical protein
MQRFIVVLLALASVLGLAGQAAAQCTYSAVLTQEEFADGPTVPDFFILTFENTPPPDGPGTLRVEAFGDFGSYQESLSIQVETVSFGILFDDDVMNDRFLHTFDSGGTDYVSHPNATAVVSQSELEQFTADGMISVRVNPSSSVNNTEDGEYVEITLEYPTTGCVGACCADDGSCTQQTETDCAASGGSFQGAGVTCEAANCQPVGTVGACCSNGSCSEVTASECSASGGSYVGDDTTCGGDIDGDFVPTACDACPGTARGALVDSDGCPLPIFGDGNRDGDVDLDDFGAFQLCASGPMIAKPAGCDGFDYEPDGDVDQDDFGAFQRCYSGTGWAADLACDD